MDRTERFYKIELLIRTRGAVSFADLMAELEVSRATLKRDLDYLRTRMDAPIVYDRELNGYRFDAAARGGGGDTSHELPGVWFSEREIHALLTMHQLIGGLDGGGTLGRHLQPVLEKLHGMLGTAEVDARELMKRVRILQPALRPVPVRHFEVVASALLRRKRITLTYWTRSKQSESERIVSPLRLVHYRNTWYLDAWCHASDGLRRFALDAVRAAEVMTQKAKEVSMKTVEAELDAGYGVYTGRDIRTASLLFTAAAAQWVASEQWHPKQELQTLVDGSLRMRLPYADDTELLMDLMRHGADVRVESPADLRRKLAERLRTALSAYER
ncbi:putative DNA-binding transcriptional regulator YafY [Sphaerotilus hippei]|uniref:Putative DNA-binding transcriptional regulator YafY n=1 Tax=Sphaerotilus hippei TaxID=744406 RepID=A0A318H2H3_9BURK|nr:WYL domain-containing protein [Sphaerotilus hippei]PXW94969.1 putative DNA-binding transcriptional regulator YafY [Sphaerotilus hippei]